MIKTYDEKDDINYFIYDAKGKPEIETILKTHLQSLTPPQVNIPAPPPVNTTPNLVNNNSNVETNTVCDKFGRCFKRLLGRNTKKNKNKKEGGRRRAKKATKKHYKK